MRPILLAALAAATMPALAEAKAHVEVETRPDAPLASEIDVTDREDGTVSGTVSSGPVTLTFDTAPVQTLRDATRDALEGADPGCLPLAPGGGCGD